MALADFATANNDGVTDLVVANGSDISIFASSDSLGDFTRITDITAASTVTSVVAADFNDDGNVDLAYATTGGNTVWVLMGNGDGTFQTPTSASVGQLAACHDRRPDQRRRVGAGHDKLHRRVDPPWQRVHGFFLSRAYASTTPWAYGASAATNP